MLAVVDAVACKTKYFCQCLLEDDSEVFLVIRATSEAQASKLVHQGYNIAYVLDILTPLQMEYRKRHLRPSIMTGCILK